MKMKRFIVVVTDYKAKNVQETMQVLNSKNEVLNYVIGLPEGVAVKAMFSVNTKAEVTHYTIVFDERLYLIKCDANKHPYLHDDTMPDEEFDPGDMF
jgi:hypothetical protein